MDGHFYFYNHCQTTDFPKQEIFDQPGDLTLDQRREIFNQLNTSFEKSTNNLKKINHQREIYSRFLNCGNQGTGRFCPECNLKFYTRFYCKFKLCDRCARIYGKEIRRKILELITPILANRKKNFTVAMLTLSESSAKYRGRYPNQKEYKNFNKRIGEFCRLFYGKYQGKISRKGNIIEDRKRYKGAGWFAVNEFGTDNNNLHCHILIYGRWIPQKVLKAAWMKISNGDTGCYIEQIKNPKVAARYVSKYITKPPVFNKTQTAIDFIEATRGQRRMRSGGIFYNTIKIDKKTNPELCPFCLVGLLYDGLVNLAATLDGLNLAYIRKHFKEYELLEIKKALNELPGGVMPYNMPFCQNLKPLWQG